MSEPSSVQAAPAAKPLGVRPWIFLGIAVALAAVGAVFLAGEDYQGRREAVYAASAGCLVAALPFRSEKGQRIQRVATILTSPVVATVLALTSG